MVQMITLEIPHVLKRGRAFRYRRVVPVDCRAAIRTEKDEPRKNWIRTWKAGTPVATVEREAAILAAEHDREIAVARGQEVTPEQIVTAESQAREMLARDRADTHEVLGFMLSQGSVNEAERVFVNALEHWGTYQPPSLSLTAALKVHHSRSRSRRGWCGPTAGSFLALDSGTYADRLKKLYFLPIQLHHFRSLIV